MATEIAEDSLGRLIDVTGYELVDEDCEFEPEEIMGFEAWLEWDGDVSGDEPELNPANWYFGRVGYLSTNYSCPAIPALLPEAEPGWPDEEGNLVGVAIPASALRERLVPILAALSVSLLVDRLSDPIDDGPRMDAEGKSLCRDLRLFVALAERLEREGRNPRVVVY